MAVPEPHAEHLISGFHSLLENHRLAPHTVLTEAVPEPTDRPTLFSLAEVLEQPETLSHQVLSDHPDAITPRMRVARLSVLHQNLALQVIAPLVTRLFRDGATAPVNPSHVWLSPKEETEGARWAPLPTYSDESERLRAGAFIAHTSHQMQAWYPVFRKHFGVSPGAYWSSVGLALGMPFSLVWNRVNPEALCTLASAWLAQFECEANRYIDWIPAYLEAQPDAQQCAIPQRRGCCLKYLLPEGGYCGTCGIYRKARLAALSPQRSNPQPAQWRPGQ